MNRRSFFGAGAAAVLAGPEIAKEAVSAGAPSLSNLSMFGEALPLMRFGEMHGIAGVSRMAAPIQFGGDRYVYRTGNPAIDALRSISGVHKALMERRLDPS